jgi:hypothetical protein
VFPAFILTRCIFIDLPPRDPCVPSPCGPYSNCNSQSDRAVCSCLPNYYGSPPNCKPECIQSSECPTDKACIQQRCVDPCISQPCGLGASCKVRNHSPICTCPPNYVGDPFVRCEEVIPIRVEGNTSTG